MSEQPFRISRVMRWISRRRVSILAYTLAVIGVVMVAIIAIRTQGPVAAVVPAERALAPTGPVEVKLGRDIDPSYKATIDPATPGTWEQRHTLLGVSGAIFRPKQRFEPGRTYHLHLTNLKRAVTGAPIANIHHTFRIQQAPEVGSITPTTGAKDVPVKTRFIIKLTGTNNDLRQLRPSLQPAQALRPLPVSADRKTYSWENVEPLKQGTAYTFVLDDAYVADQAKQRLATVTFTTVTEPVVRSARTGGLFSPGQSLDIAFDQAMMPEPGAFSWGVPGSGSWINETTYRYTPTELKPGTTYGYTVVHGLHSKAGGVLEADKSFTFSTNGAVSASLSPGSGGGVSVGTAIKATFDQPVDHASAQAHFGLNPAADGTFSWSGNVMTFKPNAPLAYQTTYSVNVSAGVVPVWGLPSAAPIARSFATEPQVVMLNVPLYRQQRSMSCELASLRMILAYRGIFVSDTDILNVVGYNPRPRDMATNTWDDPNQMYVGTVDGSAYTQKSYGVHAAPIARAAQSYGHNAIAQWGVSAQFIANYVYAGNPVEVWGHIAPAHPDAWNTVNGVVQTTTSQHARVVVGVVGSPANPIGFYVNDPWTGTKDYWSAAGLLANMNVALPASNQAVVVF